MIAERIEFWRTNTKLDAVEAADALKTKLENFMATDNRRGALCHLRLVMAGFMRGVLGAALHQLRINLETNRHKERAIVMSFKQVEKEKLVALRQLKSAMIRLVKGELSMRMDLWYSAMLDTQQEKEAEMHANEVCSTSCST